MAAPNSAERKLCWAAKDQLWKCLDDSADDAASCQNLHKEFEAKCPAQWVSHRILYYHVTQLTPDRSRCLSPPTGEVLHEEERLSEVQGEDGDTRLHGCRRPQGDFVGSR